MRLSVWAGVMTSTTCAVLLALTGCTPEQGGLLPTDLPPPTAAKAQPPVAPPAAEVPWGEQVEAALGKGEVFGSAEASQGSPPPDPPNSPSPVQDPAAGPPIFGLVGLKGYAYGQQLAPNGLEYNPLFSLTLDFNLWLWRAQRLYAFSDTNFWGQKASKGITNPTQGVFDFSKRELDFTMGLAWNYFGNLEARTFAYSFNNLNRGVSPVLPRGYNDGIGLENRYYIGPAYADLGTPAYDVARATFVSLGYYPTKDMTGGDSLHFKPGPFARAYLTYDLSGEKVYLFLDTEFIATHSWTPKLLRVDGGVAFRPFAQHPRLEFRVGSENHYDLRVEDLETGLYAEVRLIY